MIMLDACVSPKADHPSTGSGPASKSGRLFVSAAKRTFDILTVLVAAPAALLTIGVAAVVIFISSGRPVFFIQPRVGFRGKTFSMYKLRTMSNREPTCNAPTIVRDQRVTPVGAALRLYRIDELPQLLNILRGDMSLIGPRPEQPSLVSFYRDRLAWFDTRHEVRPGITGLAQVECGYASNLEETRVKLSYDLQYVINWSFALEARIFLKTVSTVIGAKGAR